MKLHPPVRRDIQYQGTVERRRPYDDRADRVSQWVSMLGFFGTTIVVAWLCIPTQREPSMIALSRPCGEARHKAWRRLSRLTVCFTHKFAPTSAPVSQSRHRHCLHVDTTFTSATASGSSIASRSSGNGTTHTSIFLPLKFSSTDINQKQSRTLPTWIHIRHGSQVPCAASHKGTAPQRQSTRGRWRNL